MGGDGLLEGCAGPGVSPRVAALLEGVLESGLELQQADIELLFTGEAVASMWRKG